MEIRPDFLFFCFFGVLEIRPDFFGFLFFWKKAGIFTLCASTQVSLLSLGGGRGFGKKVPPSPASSKGLFRIFEKLGGGGWAQAGGIRE